MVYMRNVLGFFHVWFQLFLTLLHMRIIMVFVPPSHIWYQDFLTLTYVIDQFRHNLSEQVSERVKIVHVIDKQKYSQKDLIFHSLT